MKSNNQKKIRRNESRVNGMDNDKDAGGAFFTCVECVSFSRDGTKLASGSREKRRQRCGMLDEGGVSADAGGAFWLGDECVVFSRWDEGCVGV